MASSGAAADFDAVFDRLKAILEPYGRRMYVAAEQPGIYGLDTAPEGQRNPMTWFAGVWKWKRYVSYYLMPVYVEPSLLEGVSPELRRRMQGKSCFNFTGVNERLLGELEQLTRAAYDRTAGDPEWSVSKREEHGMARRKAMDRPKR